MATNGGAGSPGTTARMATNAADAKSALALPKICMPSSAPSDEPGSSDATRVTSNPAAVDITSAGICVTRPSPIVSKPYFFSASPALMSRCRTPTARPPRRFTAVITSPATTSPFTNFIAPSIAP